MSLKTLIGILEVSISKKIHKGQELREIYDTPTSKTMYDYHDGRIDAFCEILQELEKIKKTVQEET